MNLPVSTLRRVRWLLALFIAGLVVSGLTAIPLAPEVDALVRLTGADKLTAHLGATALVVGGLIWLAAKVFGKKTT